jgi:hypothetical protein
MMPPMIGEDYCFAHHPDTRAARHDARRKGGTHSRGAATSPVPDLDVGSPAGRMHMVEHVLRDTMLQANTPARSRALAALVRLASDLDQQQEDAEIQDQLAELTRLVQEREKERGFGY